MAYAQVTEQLTPYREWQFQQTSAGSQLSVLHSQLDELLEQESLLSQRLNSYPTEDFYTRYPQDNHQQQQDLFKLSRQYLQHCALQRKTEVITSSITLIIKLSRL